MELVWKQWQQPDHGISQLVMHAYNVGSADNMYVSVSCLPPPPPPPPPLSLCVRAQDLALVFVRSAVKCGGALLASRALGCLP